MYIAVGRPKVAGSLKSGHNEIVTLRWDWNFRTVKLTIYANRDSFRIHFVCGPGAFLKTKSTQYCKAFNFSDPRRYKRTSSESALPNPSAAVSVERDACWRFFHLRLQEALHCFLQTVKATWILSGAAKLTCKPWNRPIFRLVNSAMSVGWREPVLPQPLTEWPETVKY